MAIIPLTLKHRPRKFSDVVGNIYIVKILQASARDGKISSAYFLSGTRGCGKTSLVRIFAKAICCTSPSQEGEPCLICDMCKSIANESNQDVTEIDAASNNSVDKMRTLIDTLAYEPIQAKYKVIIIDEAQSLSLQAANALLKTLEEPPEHVVFLFCTTEPDKVIETIRSRCITLKFKNILVSEISDRLLNIASKEVIAIDKEAASLIAELARGGMRDAVSLLDRLARYGETISLELIRRVLCLIDDETVLKIVEDILNGDESSAISSVHALIIDKSISDVMSAVLGALEKLYLVKVGVTPANSIQALVQIAEKISREQTIRMVESVQKAVTQFRSSILLSQGAQATFFVANLSSALSCSKIVTSQSISLVASQAQAVQSFGDVFQHSIDIADKKDLLKRFGIDSGCTSSN